MQVLYWASQKYELSRVPFTSVQFDLPVYGVNTSSNCHNGVYHVQIVLDDVTNPRVYSNEQMTQGNSVFLRDVDLSPNQTHLYALTAQWVCVHLQLH